MTITMLGNQMLNITVEEKENRVTEMILTTLDPRVLIIGKVVAVLLVGLVQLALGVVKLGTIVNFVSHPVILGFMNAAAIIIGCSTRRNCSTPKSYSIWNTESPMNRPPNDRK